jgi:hypothetical protein
MKKYALSVAGKMAFASESSVNLSAKLCVFQWFLSWARLTDAAVLNTTNGLREKLIAESMIRRVGFY